jgi:hypothetical protein
MSSAFFSQGIGKAQARKGAPAQKKSKPIGL